MSIARKTVYAAVGATGAAVERAKSLPKQAASLPGRVSKTTRSLTGATSLRELPKSAAALPRKAGQLTKKAASIPAKAGELTKKAGALPSKAAKLPGAATGLVGKATKTVTGFASEARKDAGKRFGEYATRGEKLLSRNGGNGTASAKPKAAAKKPRATKPKSSGGGASSKPSVSANGTDAAVNGAPGVSAPASQTELV